MCEFKFDVGSKVVLIENEEHPDYVREKYGKTLTVERRLVSQSGEKLYKISGIKNWGYESDFKPYVKTGVELIAEERQRQIDVEGWSLEHDREHAEGELANAGAYYALTQDMLEFIDESWGNDMHLTIWQFDLKSLKRDSRNQTTENRIRELQKAGALIAAEIDRLQHSN